MSLEIGEWFANAKCLNCDKDRECVGATCDSGTFSGPLCQTCLFREVRKRQTSVRKEEVKPKAAQAVKAEKVQDNGVPATPVVK